LPTEEEQNGTQRPHGPRTSGRARVALLGLASTAAITGLILVLSKPVATYASKTTLGFVLVVVAAVSVIAGSLWLAHKIDSSGR
jgi:hypothetical protein